MKDGITKKECSKLSIIMDIHFTPKRLELDEVPGGKHVNFRSFLRIGICGRHGIHYSIFLFAYFLQVRSAVV